MRDGEAPNIPKARQRERGWRISCLRDKTIFTTGPLQSFVLSVRRREGAAIMRRLPSPDHITRVDDDLTDRYFRLSPRFHSGGGMWNLREEVVASLRLTIDSFIKWEARTCV